MNGLVTDSDAMAVQAWTLVLEVYNVLLSSKISFCNVVNFVGTRFNVLRHLVATIATTLLR